MSDLHIPEAAQEEYFGCGCHDPRCTRVGYQPEAVPLVVAAELRRMARLDHPVARVAAVWLCNRADELDGGAS